VKLEHAMYERFTDRSRKVMQLANLEAVRLQHEYIGTEHILLGLIKEGSGVAALVLKQLGVDPVNVRREAERLIASGPEKVTIGKLPQTPRATQVLEYAIQEAVDLNHNYVGSEHILLGLLRETEGVAAHVLNNLGVSLDRTRSEILALLGAGMPAGQYSPQATLQTESRFCEPPQRYSFQPQFEVERSTDYYARPLLFFLLFSLIVNVILAALLWQQHFAK